MKGLLFSIRRYSIHDGPGIRVTFFMKGCPLKCIWCHNPEGISPEQEQIMETRRVGNREFSRAETAGKLFSVDDILTILEKERIFIEQSGGGVTFSGGEPLMQPEFLKEALIACKEEGYHTVIDTSGYASSESLMLVMPYTDMFLYDLKHVDDSGHVRLTGVSNSLIISNLRLLIAEGKDLIIRIPVIPGKNDDQSSLDAMKSLLYEIKSPGIKKISLLPFHKTGKAKYRKMGLPYLMEGTEQPTGERMKELKRFFEETGIKVKLGA